MSLNKFTIVLVLVGYVVLNVLMQVDFFAGKNIWAALYETGAIQTQVSDNQTIENANIDNLKSEVEAGKKAYYAKTAFLLSLCILLAFNIPFPLGFTIAFVLYVAVVLIFFGMNPTTGLFVFAATATLVTYFIPRNIPLGGRKKKTEK